MAELLLALPVLLLLGLGTLQAALWFHARIALNHAVLEAARAAATGNAQLSAVDSGFARGLAPWLVGANDVIGMQLAVAQTQAHIAVGRAGGWIRLGLLSPTSQSFDDWGVAARDALGREIAGVTEIPNDNLRTLSALAQPTGGSDGFVQGMPIGAISKQTLLDANVVRLYGHYGLPLNVPLIGPLVARTLQMVDGCGIAQGQQLSVLHLKQPALNAAAKLWACPFYAATDEQGNWRPRIPVELSATLRMQSPARRHEGIQARNDSPSGLASLGPGEVEAVAGANSNPVIPIRSVDRPEWERPLPSITPPSPVQRTDPSGSAPAGQQTGGRPNTEVPPATRPQAEREPATTDTAQSCAQ